jgi:uncharacterized protein (TIGR02265 family)
VPFDHLELDAALARMPKGETVRGFVFNAGVDYVAQLKGPEVASGIQERILRRRPNDLLSYSAHDYFRLIHACSVALKDPLGLDAAVRAVGHASATGFFKSPMGRLLLRIVGRGDPARLMANEPTAYATSFSFGKRTYQRTGDRSLTLEHSADFLPIAYNLGALEGALEAVEAKAQKVVATPLATDAARYDITW